MAKRALILSTAIMTCVTAPGRAADANAGAEPAPLVGDWPAEHAVCRPVSLRAVKLGGFLGAHVDANNRISLPAGLGSPIPAAIEARARGEEPDGACRRLATDSDFYKWLEGACYAIAYDPTLTELAADVERFAGQLAELQEPTGYLGTHLSPAEPFDQHVAHDLYIAGHFFETAVAHYKATGSRRLLDAALKLADFYITAWRDGHEYFKIVGQREHPEIEPALVRLYRATGQQRLLEFAEAITAMSRVGPTIAETEAGGGARHAVRFCYLLTGVAELYLQTGDDAYRQHLPGLWDEITATRMYVTGGIGYNERIPDRPFDLPQWLAGNRHRDIAETCASVALMMFSWRMHAITGQSRHYDAIETILYNHYLGAVSRDHLGNFYYNPLRRVGDLAGRTDHGANPVRRRCLPEIHSTACCLPNSWRFFAELPEYVFSHRDDAVLVNLYTDATANLRTPDGRPLQIEMQTRYPRDGRVTLRVRPERPVTLTIALRIPGWCEGATVAVAGGDPQPAPGGRYCEVTRQWHAGDEVRLDMPMPPVVLTSRPEVEANRGQVAFRRGPIVYCLEKQDAPGLDLGRAVVVLDPDHPDRSVTARYDPDLDLHVLRVRVGQRDVPPDPSRLYYPIEAAPVRDVREVSLIPFYFRANRADDTRWLTFIPTR